MDIDSFLKTIRKKYYDDLVFTLDNYPKTDHLEVIPTGSISVDICSGIGGIPLGRTIEIFGPESSGKSTLCQNIVTNAQRQNLNCLYIDTEQSLDLLYAAKCGVDTSKLIVSQPNSLEVALSLTEDAIKSGEINLIIFDSAVGVSPEKEMEDDLKDANVSLISKLLTKFFRRNSQVIKDNNVALIFTNQVRDKIGAWIPTLETTGGHAIRHMAAMRIFTARRKDIKEDTEVIGSSCEAVFKKNKLAAPFKVAKFDILFDKGIYRPLDVLTNAQEYGIITVRGTYYVYKGENIGQGKLKGSEFLSQHEDLMDEIYSEILGKVQNETQVSD